MRSIVAALLLMLTPLQEKPAENPIKTGSKESVVLADSDQKDVRAWLLMIENAQLRLDKTKSDANLYVAQLFQQYGLSPNDYDFNSTAMKFTIKEEKK